MSARGRGRPYASIAARWRPCCRSTAVTASPPINRPAVINRRQVAPFGRSLLRSRPSRLSALVASPVRPAAPTLAAALPAPSQQTTTYLPLLPPLSPRRRPAPPSVKGGAGRGAAFAPVAIIALPLPTAHFYYSLRLVRAQSARGVGSPPAPVRRPLPTWGGDKRNARVARKNTLFGWCWCASRSRSARLGLPRLAACAVPKARRRTFAAAARLCAAGAGLSGWLGCLSLRSWGLAGSLGRSLSVSAAGRAPLVKGALACRRPAAP